MSGQTKLTGFGMDGQSIQLERWGVKANADIGSGAVSILKAVCHKVLPIVPRKHPVEHLEDFNVTADCPASRVTIDMTHEMALWLMGTLNQVAKQEPSLIHDPCEGDIEDCIASIEALGVAMKAIVAYHNTNEPGVDT